MRVDLDGAVHRVSTKMCVAALTAGVVLVGVEGTGNASRAQPTLPARVAMSTLGLGGGAWGQRDPDAGRHEWQRVPDLLSAMGIQQGASVADVGAGGGFITRALAAHVGTSGRVYAVEVLPRVVERLAARMRDDGLANVEVVLGTPGDPRLPADALDAIVVVNAYHEFTEHLAMLRAFQRSLKPQGRLVLCEPTSPLPTREEQVKWHGLSPTLLVRELEETGFHVVTIDEKFIRRGSRQWYLTVAEKR